MIPIRDTIPSRSFPIVNTILIIVNIVVFFYELSLGSRLPYFINHYGLVPASFTVPEHADFRIYPLFTFMFLHSGWLHIIGNMLYLYIFGDNVEDRIGHLKYLFFYLITGLISAFSQALANLHSTIPMIGASGAIAGVLGAYILYFPRSKVLTLVPIFFFIQIVEIPAVAFLLFWFVIQFFSGVASLTVTQSDGGIAFWAHTGGFIAGLILAKPFEKKGYSYESNRFGSIFRRH
ncbi:MAG: rhomboid family intramembrane serine protease [Candidatus Dadabacteria bacterium]